MGKIFIFSIIGAILVRTIIKIVSEPNTWLYAFADVIGLTTFFITWLILIVGAAISEIFG
jgi:hypothetical protein